MLEFREKHPLHNIMKYESCDIYFHKIIKV